MPSCTPFRRARLLGLFFVWSQALSVSSFTVAQEAAPALQVAAAPETAMHALLAEAWQGTLGMPDTPHIRNRTRLQELIALRAIEAGELGLAESWAPRIATWRRGVVYADLALRLAKDGRVEAAKSYVEKAEAEAAVTAADPDGQAWYSDRIRVRIALCWHTLGDREKAAKFSAGLVDSEAGEWVHMVATEGAEKDLAQPLAMFDAIFAKGDLDQVQNGCATCIGFYDRWFDDAPRRDAIERSVIAGVGKLAPTPAIVQLTALAAAAAKHDPSRARALVADVEVRIRAIRWQPGDDIGMRARLAGVLAIAGDKAEAKAQLAARMADYGKERDGIESMNRADALVPIAEAYLQAGATADAETVYRRALAEAMENPNSRPRLDDLVGIALSLSRSELVASEALLTELRAAVRKLGNPW